MPQLLSFSVLTSILILLFFISFSKFIIIHISPHWVTCIPFIQLTLGRLWFYCFSKVHRIGFHRLLRMQWSFGPFLLLPWFHVGFVLTDRSTDCTEFIWFLKWQKQFEKQAILVIQFLKEFLPLQHFFFHPKIRFLFVYEVKCFDHLKLKLSLNYKNYVLSTLQENFKKWSHLIPSHWFINNGLTPKCLCLKL